MAKQLDHTTNRELGGQINNLVLALRDSKEFKDFQLKNRNLVERRLSNLYSCTFAVSKPILEVIDSGDITPEEGRFIAAATTLMIHSLRVNGSGGMKLPVFQDLAKQWLTNEGLSDEQV